MARKTRRFSIVRLVLGAALVFLGARATVERVRSGRLGPLAWVVPGTLFWAGTNLVKGSVSMGDMHPIQDFEEMAGAGMKRLEPISASIADMVGERMRQMHIRRTA